MDRITLKDIAEKSGVSIKTVSRVLNNEKYVQEKTRKKISEIIKELNYIPSRVARSLSKGHTKNIGFIIPDITNPFFPEIVKGASDLLLSKGYYVHLCSSDNDPEKEDLYLNDLRSMWVDGIIIAPTYSENREFQILNEISSPVVVVDREIKGLKKDLVVTNNKKGSYEVVKYLIGINHKNIVILTGPKYTVTAQNRFIGWKKAMQENNFFKPELSFWGDFTIESGYNMMINALSKIKNIDAVFACNDLIALGAIQAIEEKSLIIPQDISIIGFDDIYLSKFLKPQLTVFKVPIYDMGKIAAQILLRRIENNKNYKIKKVVIEGSLVIRRSVAKKKRKK